MQRQSSVRSRAAGFTLLEVMLTLAILAVGLLGIAAMQVVGLKSGSTAGYRSIATLVAGEMADRMRANLPALGQQVLGPDGQPIPGAETPSLYANVTGADPAANCGAIPANNCSSWLDGTSIVPAQPCTPAAMRDFDINVMFCGLPRSATNATNRTPTGVTMLPGGTMSIVCTNVPCLAGSNYNITVQWTERPEGAAAGAPGLQRSLVLGFTPMRTFGR